MMSGVMKRRFLSLRNSNTRLARCFSNVLGIPRNELTDIREHLRAFGSQEDSVTLQETSGLAQESPLKTLDEGVATVMTLRNPKARNALTGKMMAEMADCVDQLEANHEKLTAVIVRGDGGFFCAGADLGIAKDHLLTPEGGMFMSALMIDTLTRFRNLPVVTVAAIEGMAIGGGAELTTAMDFRVANPDVTLRFVHATMGLSPGWGGATRLTRLVGRQRALQLLGTALPLNTAQALDFGLLDTVVSAESSMEDTLVQFLDRYVHAHPGVLHAAKRVVSGADDASAFEDAVREEHNVFCSLWGGEANRDALEKVAAKAKKKKKSPKKA
jgi:ethylmalonyl-CoA/methylmalonyl-CoA decarboxylase